MKHFIRLFEELNDTEKDVFSELRSYGFIIFFKTDGAGYLYSCNLRLPWYAVDLINEEGKNNKTGFKDFLDFEINVAKNHIVNFGVNLFNGWQLQEWSTERNIDKALQYFLNFIESTVIGSESKTGIIVKKHTPEELQDRIMDFNLDKTIEELW